jgi:hypothetical protein
MLGGRSLTDQSIASGAVDTTTEQIAAQTGAMLTLSATGGTLTADGTEQTLVIVNEPLGCWIPRTLFVDLDNMVGVDSITLRVYCRLSDGGGLQLWDSQVFTGPDGGLVNLAKILDIEFHPNRHGLQVTLEQTAGTNRAYNWEFFAEV